jgi:hypothetical protein
LFLTGEPIESVKDGLGPKTAYLRKPYDLADLVLKIRELLITPETILVCDEEHSVRHLVRGRGVKVRQTVPGQVSYFPTVLVAKDDGLDRTLINCLQRNGFHVLEADDWEHVFDVVKVHSRPIHLLLADVSMEVRAPSLKKHRSELQIMFVKKPVDVDVVLVKVRNVLGSPPSSIS